MSAASPMSTSFTENEVAGDLYAEEEEEGTGEGEGEEEEIKVSALPQPELQSRMSAARAMSMARPKAKPCRRAMTGFSHFSIALMQDWNSRMSRRRRVARWRNEREGVR